MKPLRINDARNILKTAGCIQIRNGKHEIWQDKQNKTFALASNHDMISPGVARKMFRFIGR